MSREVTDRTSTEQRVSGAVPEALMRKHVERRLRQTRAFLPNRYTVLVIEADEKLREALVELLRSVGFRVASSATATHGIELLVYRYIDVVVCGMNLPDGAGCELVRSLKSLRCVPRSSPIPAILVAEAKEGATNAALRSGADLVCLRERALSMLIPQVLFLIQ